MAIDARVYQTTLALSHAVADAIVDAADKAITTRGRFTIALSGGSSPKPLYEMLATREYAEAINWNFTHVFWGDERCVPKDHHDSNYHMARESLLNRVKIPISNMYRIEGEREPAQAAERYEAVLRDFFGKRANTRQARFDVLLLGIGTDGHIASLFPGQSGVRETEKWVVAQHIEGASVTPDRVTLTPVALNAAANIFFVVTGEDKVPALRRIFNDPANPDELPAQAIQPTNGIVRWYLDAAAGKALHPPPT